MASPSTDRMKVCHVHPCILPAIIHTDAMIKPAKKLYTRLGYVWSARVMTVASVSMLVSTPASSVRRNHPSTCARAADRCPALI
jgi:hypothetical protein